MTNESTCEIASLDNEKPRTGLLTRMRREGGQLTLLVLCCALGRGVDAFSAPTASLQRRLASARGGAWATGAHGGGRAAVRMEVATQPGDLLISEDRPLRVLVVGGGIAGLLTACGLLKSGAVVDIVEKADALRPTGGPILIQSNALASIEAINHTIARTAMAEGTVNACRVNGVKDGLNGRWFCMFDTRAPAMGSGTPLTRVIKRQTLCDLFYQAIEDNPRAQIHYNKDLADYTQTPFDASSGTPGGVVAKFADGSEMAADVLIGADGLWSAVRSVMHGEGAIKPDLLADRVRSAKVRRAWGGRECALRDTGGQPRASYTARVPTPPSPCPPSPTTPSTPARTTCSSTRARSQYSGYACYEARCHFTPDEGALTAYKVYIGRKKYFVLCDIGGGMQEWYAFIYTTVGTGEAASEYAPTLREAFGGWQQEVLDVIDATPAEDIKRRDTFDRAPEVFRGWTKGSVAIMGDAAHPMMPNLGQGGCQAIEDAYRLSLELGRVERRDQIPAALKRYEARRLPRAAIVQGVARIASDMLRVYSRYADDLKDWFSDPFVFASSVGSIFAPRMFPFILGYLFQPDLDPEDQQYIQQRMATPRRCYDSDVELELDDASKLFDGRVPSFDELSDLVKRKGG